MLFHRILTSPCNSEETEASGRRSGRSGIGTQLCLLSPGSSYRTEPWLSRCIRVAGDLSAHQTAGSSGARAFPGERSRADPHSLGSSYLLPPPVFSPPSAAIPLSSSLCSFQFEDQ